MFIDNMHKIHTNPFRSKHNIITPIDTMALRDFNQLSVMKYLKYFQESLIFLKRLLKTFSILG